MCKAKAEKKIYYLYPKQIKYINRLSREKSVSPSAVLRMMINKDISDDK